MDKEWLIEEAYTDRPLKNNCSKEVSPQVDRLKCMSLYDIAKSLNSKPDFSHLDKED